MNKIYKDNTCERYIVDRGSFDGHKWFITSLGTYPCAYVKSDIPEDLQNDIDCHGGITFWGNGFPEFEDDSVYIGWDYAHACDYSFFNFFNENGKKWTVEEIKNEIIEVVEQLKTMGY